MASSSTSSSNSINEGSQQYPYPCHVNAASFLSIKLSGKPNYLQWQEQMTCLMDSYDMLGFIDGTLKKPLENTGSKMKSDVTDFKAKYREWKRSDTLVKGWIFGSITEDVMGTVMGLQTANDVWDKLKASYTTPPAPAPVTVIPPDTTTRKKDVGEYIPLCRAIQIGDWEKAQEFFNDDKDALVDKLNVDGHRSLHVAIGNHENFWFLHNLLELIHPESLPTLVDNKQQNALHYAALVDNPIAAAMLVEKNPHLLFTVDYEKYLPIQKAVFNSHKTTFLYLLQVCKQYIELSKRDGHHNPFEGEKGVSILNNTILSGFLDVAYDLLKDYPELARTKVDAFKAPLWCIAKKCDAYPSGEQYSFFQRFVYSYLPMENYNKDNSYKIQDKNQEKANHVKMGMNSSYVYPDVPPAYLPGTYNKPDIENQDADKGNHVCMENHLPSGVPDNEKLQTYTSSVSTGVNPPSVYPPDIYPPGCHPPSVCPPGGCPPGVYPPGVYPPGSYPQGVYPPGGYPPSMYPPGVYPPGDYPPGMYPPGVYPPGLYPQGVYPPGGYPPSVYPPGVYPPSYPSNGCPPGVYPDVHVPYHFPGPFPGQDNQETCCRNPLTKCKKSYIPPGL